MPLVSICIPCHNAGATIQTTLDSVFAQTWEAFEIVVVNDSSSDNSEEILKTFTDRRLTVLNAACGSAAKARNLAFEASTGDCVKFLDADDLISPEMIERQLARLNGRVDAIASSQWGRFYKDDRSTFRLNPESVWRDMDARDWLVEAWRDARPMMQSALFLIPRKILEKVGGWDESLSLIDDFEFFARVISSAEAVLFTPDATLYYRSGLSGSLSGRKSREAVESAFHSLISGTSHLLARRQDPEAKQSCANMLQDFIYTYYPDHADLREKIARRIAELGGSVLEPDGPPRFHQLRRVTGWQIARRIQRLAGH